MITSANVVISVLDIASLAVLLIIVDLYTKGSYSTRFGFLVNKSAPSLPITLFLIFFLCKNICAYLVHHKQYRFFYAVASRISGMNLLCYLEGDLSSHTETDSAVWIKKISQQPVEFSHYILAGLQQAITETALILFSITAILFFNAKIFLLLFLILIPAILILSLFMKARLRKTRQLIKAGGERSLRHLKEALNGYIESRLYNKNDFFLNRYSTHQQELNTHLSELQAIQGAPVRLMEVFAVAGLFILITIHTMYGATAIDILTIGAFVAAAYKIIPGFVKLINIRAQLKTYSFTLDMVKPLEVVQEKRTLPAASIGKIEFREISFAFPGKKILSKQSFSIGKGELTAISGNSGKGKTTLINILLGLLAEESGSVLFDGAAVIANNRKQFWNDIAYVKQQPFMLHDSILTNIVLDENRYDAVRLDEAVLHSGLGSMLHRTSGGIHKLVTENGRNISGGQRQRVALARALYKNAGVLILDEPFNELDRISVLELMNYLQRLAAEGKIVILITHDPECLSFCNTVISIDEKP